MSLNERAEQLLQNLSLREVAEILIEVVKIVEPIVEPKKEKPSILNEPNVKSVAADDAETHYKIHSEVEKEIVNKRGRKKKYV